MQQETVTVMRLLRRGVDLIRTEGPLSVPRRIRHWVSERYYEHRFGIMTSGIIQDPRIHNKTTCFAYEPTDYQSFRKLFKRLRIRKDRDVFLDYGSGMGRAVIMAATYPFHRVIGVEVSTELNSVAKENLRRVRSKLKCKNIQFVTADARSYVVPPDVTFVYLFSPFGEEIISRVVDNVRLSLCHTPRKLTVIYNNPRIFENMISNCDWLIKRWEFHRWDGLKFVGYESRPEAFLTPDVTSVRQRSGRF